MQRMNIIIILVITTIQLVHSLPICDSSMEAPPIFIKPLILPPSFTRSTLNPELLKILGHSQSNSISQESTSSPSSSNSLSATDNLSFIPPAVPSSTIFNQFSTLYIAPSEFPNTRQTISKLNTVESNSNSFGTSNIIPTTTTSDSFPTTVTHSSTDLDRTTNNKNTASSSVLSPEQFPNAVPLSAASYSPTTISAEMSPTNNTPITTTPPDAYPLVSGTTSSISPFHGSTLLPIKPLHLPPTYNQELQTLLSNYTNTTSSQKPVRNPHHNSLTESSADPHFETSPQLSSVQSDFPSTVSQTPAPTPIQSSSSVLNPLLNSRITINQLNSLLAYSTPNSNFNPLPAVGRQLSSTYKSSLNRSFINYLLNLPYFRRSSN